MIEYSTELGLDFMKGTYVLEFYARWCGTCRQVTKSFLALEPSTEANFIRIDVEKEKQCTKKYHVKGIPYIIIIKDGVEIARKGGSLTVTEFESFLLKSL